MLFVREKLTFYRLIARTRPPSPWPSDLCFIRRSRALPRLARGVFVSCNSPLVSGQPFLQLDNRRRVSSHRSVGSRGWECERLDLGGRQTRRRKALGDRGLSNTVASTTGSGSTVAGDDSSRYGSEVPSPIFWPMWRWWCSLLFLLFLQQSICCGE